jgi:hypothetical protein
VKIYSEGGQNKKRASVRSILGIKKCGGELIDPKATIFDYSPIGLVGSLGGYDAGPAFFLVFGRRRYVFVWDYLVLRG